MQTLKKLGVILVDVMFFFLAPVLVLVSAIVMYGGYDEYMEAFLTIQVSIPVLMSSAAIYVLFAMIAYVVRRMRGSWIYTVGIFFLMFVIDVLAVQVSRFVGDYQYDVWLTIIALMFLVAAIAAIRRDWKKINWKLIRI